MFKEFSSFIKDILIRNAAAVVSISAAGCAYIKPSKLSIALSVNSRGRYIKYCHPTDININLTKVYRKIRRFFYNVLLNLHYGIKVVYFTIYFNYDRIVYISKNK